MASIPMTKIFHRPLRIAEAQDVNKMTLLEMWPSSSICLNLMHVVKSRTMRFARAILLRL